MQENSFNDISKRYRDEMMRLYKKNPAPQNDFPLQNDVLPELTAEIPEEPTAMPQPTPVLPSIEKPQPKTEYKETQLPPFMRKPDAWIMPQNETNDFMLPDSYDAVPSATGKLKVIVSAGDFAVPIENAYVVVTRTERGKTHLYHILTTDRSGETPTVELPTVSEALSEAPVNGVSPPYISYTINTYLKGFYEVQNNDVPIFAEITSVQPVRLIPLPFLGERSKLAFNEEEPDL